MAKSSREKSRKEKSSREKCREKSRKEKSQGASRHNEQIFIDLYYAIYTPRFRNYYYWAFATYNQQTTQWRIFEVV